MDIKFHQSSAIKDGNQFIRRRCEIQLLFNIDWKRDRDVSDLINFTPPRQIQYDDVSHVCNVCHTIDLRVCAVIFYVITLEMKKNQIKWKRIQMFVKIINFSSSEPQIFIYNFRKLILYIFFSVFITFSNYLLNLLPYFFVPKHIFSNHHFLSPINTFSIHHLFVMFQYLFI